MVGRETTGLTCYAHADGGTSCRHTPTPLYTARAFSMQATTALSAAEQPPPPGGPGTGGPAAAATAECLVPLRSQCLELLHSLHPDSLPFLAELITGCVMQVGRVAVCIRMS